ncbi:MAG: gamma-glutamyl-gamma-aminobutyrate hydrolase family protein [Treponema sp.]|jgi:putative glutamine amidotransferase|nr:gamma-glutamyl-gamma-aminobutyrate hydrolase family protein [Treponema sp.]
MKPLILITGEEGISPSLGSPHFVLSAKYPRAFAAAGTLPLSPQDFKLSAEYAELAEGLVLTEGPGIHRGRYGKYYRSREEMAKLCPSRDDFEFALFRAFVNLKKPVLGFGRGMEIINVALGGTLTDDAEPDAGEERRIRIPEDTRAGKAVGTLPPARGNPARRIERLAPALRIWAESGEGVPVIEGIEHTELPLFGVNWRGEWEDVLLGKLVPWFACRREKAKW